MAPFAREIIELNIRHYRRLLLDEDIDPKTRRTIECLLLREEKEFRELRLAKPTDARRQPSIPEGDAGPYEIAPRLCEERDAKFYRELAEDARMLAARLQDKQARSTILEIAAVFTRSAASLDTEERNGENVLDAFVSEGNVELYLSKAYRSFSAHERDRLLRLVAEEEGRMGGRREHMDNGQRRLNDCEQRVQQQRQLVHALSQQGHNTSAAHFLLQTYERTLVLLRGHQQILVERFEQARL